MIGIGGRCSRRCRQQREHRAGQDEAAADGCGRRRVEPKPDGRRYARRRRLGTAAGVAAAAVQGFKRNVRVGFPQQEHGGGEAGKAGAAIHELGAHEQVGPNHEAVLNIS